MTRYHIALLVVLIIGSTHRFTLAQDPATAPTTPPMFTGTLTYPAIDNLDFREGTIEWWIKLTFDPKVDIPTTEYKGLASVMTLGGDSGGMAVSIFVPQNGTRPHWWCSIGPKTVFTPMGIEAPIEAMTKDEWHHVAIVWKDDQTWSYFDGKKAGSHTHQATVYKGFGPPVASKPIMLGDRWNHHGKFAIDDVRISRVARKPDELGFHGELKPDAYTAILDRFEKPFEPDDKTTTTPDAILSGTGGLVTVPCQFVEGKFGMGLQMHK